MTQLLTHYTVSEIIIFIVILALAIKATVEFFDWAKKRTTEAVKEAEKPSELEQIIKKHDSELQQIKDDVKDIKKCVNILMQSDKDDIKQSITKDHHYYCYHIGAIDDYSLDCIEKRYGHYKDYDGNSFIKTLMQEIRNLPKVSQKEV